MRRESKTKRVSRARRRIVAETASRERVLRMPMAKRRSAVRFPEPWPVRMVPLSSSQLPSST